MISSLAWIPPGAPRRVPFRAELSREEVLAIKHKEAELAGLDAEDVDGAEGGAGAPLDVDTDPALASLRDVKLPAGADPMADDDDVEDGEALGRRGGIFTSTFHAIGEADPNIVTRGGAATGGAAGAAAQALSGVSDPLAAELDPTMDEEDYEDVEARAGDSFLCAARTDQDSSSLEVFTYVRADGNLFTHHGFTLPTFPLCLAWADCAPGLTTTDASQAPADCPVSNVIAVGTFRPGIEIWNLDVTEPLEPIAYLGGPNALQHPHQSALTPPSVLSEHTAATRAPEVAASGKKGKKARAAARRARAKRAIPGPHAPSDLAPGSHTDAVIGLAWNRTHRQLLASASADTTVRLWDVRKGVCIHTFRHHTAKAAAVAWHPSTGTESSVLASASFDRTAAVIDARTPAGAIIRMPLPTDVEALQWAPHSGTHVAAALDNGEVHVFDIRRPDAPAMTIRAHNGECTSLAFVPRLPGILVTAGVDRAVRVWDLAAGAADGRSLAASASLLGGKEMMVGRLFAAQPLPHAPLLLAAAGDAGKVAIWDVEHDNPTLFGAATRRLVPPAAVPCLHVRPRADGQPVPPGDPFAPGASEAATSGAAAGGAP